MRRRQLKRLGARLHQLKGMALIRDELLLKLGAAKQQSPSALILNDFFLVFTANPLSRANAPLPIAFAKRGLQNFYKWDLSQSLDYEAYVLELTLKMQDFKEGFTAFLEKRDPIFKGE
jgi:enoyl-CoA hydratase/carnithine racemase